jgi:hypothetical protein
MTDNWLEENGWQIEDFPRNHAGAEIAKHKNTGHKVNERFWDAHCSDCAWRVERCIASGQPFTPNGNGQIAFKVFPDEDDEPTEGESLLADLPPNGDDDAICEVCGLEIGEHAPGFTWHGQILTVQRNEDGINLYFNCAESAHRVEDHSPLDVLKVTVPDGFTLDDALRSMKELS